MIILFWILFAMLTMWLASSQGRNLVLAGVLGFFFGIFALLGYAIAGKTAEKKLEEFAALKALQKDD